MYSLIRHGVRISHLRVRHLFLDVVQLEAEQHFSHLLRMWAYDSLLHAYEYWGRASGDQRDRC